jgi:ELWxxDGT repeat protein
LYFTAIQTGADYQLWISDGTAAGTKVIAPAVASVTAPTGQTSEFFMFDQDSSLYFAANYTSGGIELWKLKDTTGQSVGIASIAEASFALYPNPNNGTFTLQLDDANFTKGTLQVYDAVGRKVYEQQVNSRKETIRMQQPAGIYTVKLQLGDAVLTKQIVIE